MATLAQVESSGASSGQSSTSTPVFTNPVEAGMLDKGTHYSMPVLLLDATIANTDIVTLATYVFKGRLSLARMEETWYQLVDIWPVLAGRIRRSKDWPSGLEYQVPKPARLAELRKLADPLKRQFFALDESHRDLSDFVPIVANAHTYSRDRIYASYAPDLAEEERLSNQNGVKWFTQLLKEDIPMCTMQVTTFREHTMVSLNFSHIMGDAFSIKAILSAWADLLNGKTVPPLTRVSSDPFAAFAPGGKYALPADMQAKLDSEQSEEKRVSTKAPPEPPVPVGWTILDFWAKILLLVDVLIKIYFTQRLSTWQAAYIYIPDEQVTKLKEEANAYARQREKVSELPGGKPLLTTSQVLYAWLLKNSLHSWPAGKISQILNVANLKLRTVTGFDMDKAPGHGLWGGSVPIPYDPISAGQVQQMSVGELATWLRDNLSARISAENFRATMAFTIYHSLFSKPSGKLPFFGKARQQWEGVTDWRAVKFSTVDFGGALEVHSDEKERSAPLIGIIGFAYMPNGGSLATRWVAMGDVNGGTWYGGFIPRHLWHVKGGFGDLTWIETKV